MTMKTLLLGAAAGLVTVGAAQAADLPMLKAEPVEYVKVCSEFGAGFFYIPGTDTCLKISGEVRADAIFTQPQNTIAGEARENNLENFQGRARVQFDARTATDYGTLRSFVSVDFLSPDAVRGTNGVNTNRGDIDKAFVQFGGFTAGFAESFFAFYDNLYGDTFFAPYYGDQGNRLLFAYTATFGGGFAATLSIEDAKANRTDINSTELTDDGLPVTYGGTQLPDIVASLFYDAGPNGFGKAQVMAAVHQVRSDFEPYDTDYGFAVGAGASINLPFAAGAYVAIEGEYEQGAGSYIGGGAAGGGQATAFDEYGGPAVGGFDTDLGSGFSIEGEAGVNLTPSLTALVFGSYINYDAPGINGFFGTNGVTNVGDTDDFDGFVVGGNLTYTVAKGLTVGAEVSYVSNSYSDFNTYGLTGFDSVQGGVRIKRTF